MTDGLKDAVGSKDAPGAKDEPGSPPPSAQPSRFSTNSLIAFLGSLIAVVVPISQMIEAHTEVALKQKELDHSITMEFLELAISKDTAPPDRLQVLQVISQLDNPLHIWAAKRIQETSAEIASGDVANEAFFSAMKNAKSDLDAAAVSRDLLERDIDRAEKDGDFAKVRDLQPKYIEACIKINRAEKTIVTTSKLAPPSIEGRLGQLPSGSIEVKTGTADIGVAVVEKMFPTTPIANIRSNLASVLDALKKFGLSDRTMVLIALATIRAETELFIPGAEGQSRFNTSPGGHPFDLYDSRKDLGNQGPPDGEKYRGRGFVLLTGRAYYATYSSELGLGNRLVDDPDSASTPQLASLILAAFLKDKEAALREAAQSGDLATVRRLVNGGSNGLLKFESAYTIGDREWRE